MKQSTISLFLVVKCHVTYLKRNYYKLQRPMVCEAEIACV